MKPTIIYITGFRQHAGKTVTSLGLLSLFRKYMDPAELGYIKPVGQELVTLADGEKIDKDARIIQEFGGIPDLDMQAVSPVRVGPGFTRAYLDRKDPDNATDDLRRAIGDAVDRLSSKRIIIAEGTGHPGVGGIFGLSNAEVNNLIGGKMVFLSGGGIGKALDMLEVDLTYFMHKGSDVRGVLFNKVIEKKIPQVRRYITEDLLQQAYPDFPNPLRIFGFLPEESHIAKPSMRVLADLFKERKVLGDKENISWKKPYNNLRVLSLSAEYLHPERYIKPGDFVLLGSASNSRKSRLLSYQRALQKGKTSIGGLILTCGDSEPPSEELEEEIIEAGIPTIVVDDDTAEAERKIIKSLDGTKLQVYDDEKAQLVEKMFAQYFDLERFSDAFELGLKI
ncbi:MAG: AAA family ATPase [Spirochaetales bacterium]|nr:AAA family ATPase [Spirochaetales bacterium]MCF7939237.1 AAA family ATPase [Spirochaetales bacterium]